MLLADGVAAIVGSMNLAPGSLDLQRELGIEAHDAEIVERLQTITRDDWRHSHALDLSDGGLVAVLNHGSSRLERALDVNACAQRPARY